MLRAVFNWLFRPERAAPQPPQVEQAGVPPGDLGARLTDLERGMADVSLLRLEWAEVLDKLQAWTNRQNARDAKRVKAGLETLGGQETAQEPLRDTNGLEPIPDMRAYKAALRQRLRAQTGGNR